MANVSGGTVVWDLSVDSSKLSKGLADARSQVSKMAKDVDSSVSNLSSTVKGALENATGASLQFAAGLSAVGLAGIGAVGFGVKMAADIETARQGFVTLLGSAEKADAALDQIKRDAASTPFEFAGLVRANQLLTSVTKDAGQSEAMLLNVGKALAAAGKGGAELDNVIVNLQQIANTGKITEMDIRQFGFAGINILELLADHYGVTKDAAGDMVKNSANAFKDLEDAFAKAGGAGGKFERAFIDQAGTFNQLMSNFRDVMGQTAAEIAVSTGAFDAVKEALGTMVDVMVRFKPEIIQGIKDFFSFVRDNGPLIAGIIIGGLTPAIYAMAVAIGASVIALAPFLLVGAAVGLVVQLLITHFSTIQSTLNGFVAAVSTMATNVGAWFASIPTTLSTALTSAVLAVQNFIVSVQLWFDQLPFLIIYSLGLTLGAIVAWGINTYNYLATAVPMWISSISNWFSALPGMIAMWLAQVLVSFLVWGGNTWSYLSSAVPMWINSIITWVGAMPGRISEALSNLGSTLRNIFSQAWSAIVSEVSTWPGRLREWGMNVGMSFVDGIKAALSKIKDAFVQGFNDAKNSIQGHSPPKEGPFKEIDQWGFNVGNAWVDGMRSAIQGFSLPDVSISTSTSDSRDANMFSDDGGSRGFGSQSIIVNIGTVQNQSDIDQITSEIGFRASLLPAI